MKLVWSWVYSFGHFWYHYIFGDDWTMAVAVGAGLIVTSLLNRSHVVAWWLIPVIVVLMLGISLRRAGARP